MKGIVAVVSAYSSDAASAIEKYERVLELLRRAGADLNADHRAVRRLRDLQHEERAERYRGSARNVGRAPSW